MPASEGGYVTRKHLDNLTVVRLINPYGYFVLAVVRLFNPYEYLDLKKGGNNDLFPRPKNMGVSQSRIIEREDDDSSDEDDNSSDSDFEDERSVPSPSFYGVGPLRAVGMGTGDGGLSRARARWPQAPLKLENFSELAANPGSELAKVLRNGRSDADKAGYLYAFTTESVPNAIKVGFSEAPKRRYGEHRACFGEIMILMEEVNMVYEKLAEKAVHAILKHFGRLRKVTCSKGDTHTEWFEPPRGVEFGVWRDSVRNAIDWVSHNVRDGARGKRQLKSSNLSAYY